MIYDKDPRELAGKCIAMINPRTPKKLSFVFFGSTVLRNGCKNLFLPFSGHTPADKAYFSSGDSGSKGRRNDHEGTEAKD